MAGKFEIGSRSNGECQFSPKAGNGQVIGKRGMHSSMSAPDNGIQAVMAPAPTADVVSDIA